MKRFLTILSFCLPMQAILVGDFNGDGRPDAAMSRGTYWAIYLNQGNGRFEPAQKLERIGIAETGGGAVADMNRDGSPDLVLGSHDSYRVAVMLNDGHGRFTHAAGSPFIPKTGGKPHNHGLAVGDLNRDGHLDAISANMMDGDVTVWFGDGKGGLRAHGFAPIGPSVNEVALRDANGDGYLDIAATAARQSAPYAYLALGDGEGGFQPQLPPLNQNPEPPLGARLFLLGGNAPKLQGSSLPARHWGVALGDLDLDGRTDLALAAKDSVYVVYANGGNRSLPTDGDTWDVAIADVDGDGKAEILATIHDGASFVVLTPR
jgi:hypothetical protein